MSVGSIKHIDGIQWAADVLSGQRPFPSFNKIDPLKQEEDTDFAQVFSEACAEVDLRKEKTVSSI